MDTQSKREKLDPEDAIALWRKGKECWNQWVEENPVYNIDFSNFNFGEHAHLIDKKISFSGFKFPEGTISFSDTDFGNNPVEFRGTDFGKGDVNFSNSRFKEGTVAFTNARFNEGNIKFDNIDFGNSNVSFDGAKFERCHILFASNCSRFWRNGKIISKAYPCLNRNPLIATSPTDNP